MRRAVRERIQEVWSDERLRVEHESSFLPAASVTNHLPMDTVNYADYVSSRGHAENVGVAGPLLPSRNGEERGPERKD